MSEDRFIFDERKPQEFQYGRAYAFQIQGVTAIFKAGARGSWGEFAVLDGKLTQVTIKNRRKLMGVTECMCLTEDNTWIVLEKGRHIFSLHAEFTDGTNIPDGTLLQENHYKTSKANTPIAQKWGREAKLKQLQS